MRFSVQQITKRGAALAAALACAGSASVAAQSAKHAEVLDHASHATARAADMPPARTAKPPGAFAEQPASTQRMAALLQEIWRSADIRKNPFRSDEQIRIFEDMLATRPPLDPLLDLLPNYGQALLQSGRPVEALQQFYEIERLLVENHRPMGAQVLSSLLAQQAVCHLRIGEQENCLLNHNADSCLLPIRGGGVHQLPNGSRGAITVLERLLAKYPGDLRARWLLNIAYMTLGEYPDKVPPRWLIDPQLFESDYDIQRFPDVAGKLGLDVNDLAGGVVLEDFDDDGFLDLMVSGWGFVWSQLRLFRNNGDGTFTERTMEAGLAGLVSGLNLIHGDYNNDGWMDVLVLRGGWLKTQGHYPCSLLRNNGDFTFTDVTEEAGMLHYRPTQTAAWFDYNGDGWLDIFIGNESTENDPNPCELFRNNGDGTFTECALVHDLDFVAFVKGVVAGDYNNDGRPDLFISVVNGPKKLLRNDGPAGPNNTSAHAPWRFTDVTDAAGIGEPRESFPCWFWDYNNDGQLDVMVTGYGIQDVGDIAADVLGLPHGGHRARLYRNNGDGTFTDVSKEAGVLKVLHTMGTNFGDLDNDGWLDFYCGTGNPDFATLIPNRMFRNDGGRRFQDVTTSGGFGQLQKGHGIAFGDIDNDGDQDIYSVVGGANDADRYHNQLFANPGHGNHWLKLKLEGVRSNRPAIGARLKVVVQTAAGERTIYRTVGSGASFGAAPVRRTEIGLGQARAISRVEIFWPTTGVTQVVRNLAMDQCYKIREGADSATPVTLAGFTLPTSPDAPDRHHGGGHACCPVDAAGVVHPEKCSMCNPIR